MKKPSLKYVICFLLILVIGAGIYYGLYQKNENARVDRPVNSVEFEGPTKEEQQAGDNQKANNENREEIDKQPATTKTADIILVDAGQYQNVVEVRAYIANEFSDDGTCTLVMTKGTEKVTSSNQSFKDAKNTQCGTFTIDRSKFNSSGIWQMQLSYNSPSSSGGITRDITIN